MSKNVFEGKVFDLDPDIYTKVHNAFLELEKKDISHYAKWLYVLLKKYAGSNGKTIPSTKEISKKLICSERMVQGAMKELMEKGYFLKFNRFAKGGKYNGGQLSNGYALLKIDDETGFPKSITKSEIYFAISTVSELEENVTWVIDSYLVKKHGLEITE